MLSSLGCELVLVVMSTSAAKLGMKHKAGEADEFDTVEDKGLGDLAQHVTEQVERRGQLSTSPTASQIETEALQVIRLQSDTP